MLLKSGRILKLIEKKHEKIRERLDSSNFLGLKIEIVPINVSTASSLLYPVLPLFIK